MLKRNIFLFSLFVFSLFSACKRDLPLINAVDVNTKMSGIELAVLGKVENLDFYMRSPFLLPGNRVMIVDELKLYLAEIEFLNVSGKWIPAKDYLLVDFNKNHFTAKTLHGKGERFKLELPPGSYKSIRFCLGLPPLINASDPTPLAPNHPLSIYQGMYWDWNSGYRFIMMEGTLDTAPDNPLPYALPFAYHLGTDTLYYCQEYVFPEMQVKYLRTGEDFKGLVLELDIRKVFYSDQDTIYPEIDPVTHTAGNLPLAFRIQENLKKAWRCIPE